MTSVTFVFIGEVPYAMLTLALRRRTALICGCLAHLSTCTRRRVSHSQRTYMAQRARSLSKLYFIILFGVRLKTISVFITVEIACIGMSHVFFFLINPK